MFSANAFYEGLRDSRLMAEWKAGLIFANGGEARFVPSRAAEERERCIAITYKSGEVSTDFIAKCFVDRPNFGLYGVFEERIST